MCSLHKSATLFAPSFFFFSLISYPKVLELIRSQSQGLSRYSKIYLVVILPHINILDDSIFLRWYNYIGYVIIKNVEFLIDGKLIDKHTNKWFYIYNELQKNNSYESLNKLIGNVEELYKFEKSKNKIER